MISLCNTLDSGDPVPPLPVFCTARCKGVDPLLFLSRTEAPLRSSEALDRSRIDSLGHL